MSASKKRKRPLDENDEDDTGLCLGRCRDKYGQLKTYSVNTLRRHNGYCSRCFDDYMQLRGGHYTDDTMLDKDFYHIAKDHIGSYDPSFFKRKNEYTARQRRKVQRLIESELEKEESETEADEEEQGSDEDEQESDQEEQESGQDEQEEENVNEQESGKEEPEELQENIDEQEEEEDAYIPRIALNAEEQAAQLEAIANAADEEDTDDIYEFPPDPEPEPVPKPKRRLIRLCDLKE